MLPMTKGNGWDFALNGEDSRLLQRRPSIFWFMQAGRNVNNAGTAWGL